MNVQLTWNRLQPDTISGEKIIVKTIYSSFDKKEIDELQSKFEETYGSGVVGEVEKQNYSKWINNMNGTFECDNCGCKHSKSKFCPDCGKRME